MKKLTKEAEMLQTRLLEVLDIFPEIKNAVEASKDPENLRKKLLQASYATEEQNESEETVLHPLERVNVKDCIRVFRNFLSKRNEKFSGQSFVETLFGAVQGDEDILASLTQDFIDEVYHILKGMQGKSGVYSCNDINRGFIEPAFLLLQGREAALARSEFLDELSCQVENALKKYPTGLSPEVWLKRRMNSQRIMKYFDASEQDWLDYRWHLKHLIRDSATLGKLVELTEEEKRAIDGAKEKKIPFGITPYYVSLMDREAGRQFDHAVRAQVIPPVSYIEEFQHLSREEMDFMRETDTSPVDLVTRRYPMIAIFKPFNTCAQICVYCQRNWEIDDVNSPYALAREEDIEAAINWFENNPHIKAVLITGGDPLILPDEKLDEILGRFSEIPHIERIRLGTRTPVVLPSRFTSSLIDIFEKYHMPGKREICIVTHFEHPYEVTPEAMEAVQEVKRRTSINFYNQQVFTIENSRRFETVALRSALKNIGIDPYYVFHAKGKKETAHYIVPIARLLQERKEEARLTPGLVRTDEPVYNIPGTGKNHLRAVQDHELIMLTPWGTRIYEMHPWEKAIVTSNTYLYEDVSIGSYLARLKSMGEDVAEYKTIWYYY